MRPERHAPPTPWTLVRATFCVVSLGIIVTRPFTHNVLITIVTSVALGVILGLQLRLYTDTHH